MPSRSWTDQQLISATKNGVSYADVCRDLGLVVTNGNYRTLKKHIDREETLVYPYVIKLSSSLKTASISDSVISMIKEYSITLYEEEHDDVEEKLNDLKNIIIKYLPTVKDQKNRFLLLKELSALENDLADHARIEDLILLPKVEILEKKALLG